MKTNQVQPLNYSAHAIEDLKELVETYRQSAPASARAISRLVELLDHSVKFILPNCCELVEPEDIRQSHVDLARLPFPCVAFEAPWYKDSPINQVGAFAQTPATKRIALCWEPHPEYEVLPNLHAPMIEAFPEGGAFVVPIYWTEQYKRWTVGLGGGFFPYANVLERVDLSQAPTASRIANEALMAAGLGNSKQLQYRCEPFFLQPELFEATVAHRGGDRDNVFAEISVDAGDEVSMLIQACSVLNCANVKTVDVSAGPALNKKRRRQGKQEFFTYKVLQLTDEKPAAPQKGIGGHASPRMHLRRGHLRKLEEKSIWVRATMVNAGSKDGVVMKDYAVKTTSPA